MCTTSHSMSLRGLCTQRRSKLILKNEIALFLGTKISQGRAEQKLIK